MKTDVKGSPRDFLHKLLTDNVGAPATCLKATVICNL